jgi:hypothetical protein
MKTGFGILILSLLAVTQGCDSQKEIHPGLDFPVYWLPKSRESDTAMIIETANANARLALQKHYFKEWCNRHSIPFDENQIHALTIEKDALLKHEAYTEASRKKANLSK